MFTKNKNTTAASIGMGNLLSRFLGVGFAAFMMVLMLSATSAQAAAPPAGTNITNQASATYTDNTNVAQEAFSNIVVTTVAEVGSFTLLSDSTKTAAKGTTAYMPHVLTNTGNSTDTFTLKLPAGFLAGNQLADLDSIGIYLDANFDGVADNVLTPICTITSGANTCQALTPVSLDAGAKYGFVVAMFVKSTAVNADVIEAEVVTATPTKASIYPTGGTSPPATNGAAYGAAKEKINTDNLTISNVDPVFTVTKSIVGATSGPRGTTITYRIAYTNDGLGAGPLYLKDTVGTGAMVGANYIAGTGKWFRTSTGTTVAMTDAALGDVADVARYSAITVPAGGAGAAATLTDVVADIYSVAVSDSGYIEFQAIVLNTAALGASTTTNIAFYGVPTTCTADADICTAPVSPANTPNVLFIVTTGELQVVKTQATSVGACPATSGALTFATTPITTAKPGDCLWYKIVATNIGDAQLETANAILKDTIPQYTTYAKTGTSTYTAGLTCSTVGAAGTASPSALANGAAAGTAFQCGTWTRIPIGASISMEFAVQIDQ